MAPGWRGVGYEARGGHQPGLGQGRLRDPGPFPGPDLRGTAAGREWQPGPRGQAVAGLPGPRRCRGSWLHRGCGPARGRGEWHPGHHRSPPRRHPAGMGLAPRPAAARRLLQQCQGAVLFGPGALQAGARHVRVHPEPGVRGPAAAARRAEAADLAREPRALRYRRALHPRVDAAGAAAGQPGQGLDALRAEARHAGRHGHRRPGPRARRFRHRGAGGQDHRHLHRQRPPHRAVQAQGRADGRGWDADAVRARGWPGPAGRDDHRRHRQVAG